MLGYPQTEPSSVDLSPAPRGCGAKPTLKPSAQSSRPVPAQPVASGPPLPKRPKGRLFIGGVFLCAFVALGYAIFNSTLRYTAYGEVLGRRIDMAVPWPGVVESLHVREGDHVQRGDLIARINSLKLRQRIEEIDDQLRLQRAELASELAMLRWEAEKIRDLHQLSQSEFYDKWSELLWEQSRLEDLRVQLDRHERMHEDRVASTEQLESLQFQFKGQTKRVEQLTEAVRALKQRSRESVIDLDLEDRVRPTLARIENLQAELQRVRRHIKLGEIRAPASGTIVRTRLFAGEYAHETDAIAELLVDGSTEFVLYVHQSEAMKYPIGRAVRIKLNPSNQHLDCEVTRVAIEMQKAPESISRYYEPDESLLPVFLRAKDRRQSSRTLTLGSEIRVPRTENSRFATRIKHWSREIRGSLLDWSSSAAPSKLGALEYQPNQRQQRQSKSDEGEIDLPLSPGLHPPGWSPPVNQLRTPFPASVDLP